MNQENIKKIIEEVMRRMGVGFDEVLITTAHDRTAFVVKTKESHLLIGARGAHIAALNHLVRRIAGKGVVTPEEGFDFYVDVNDYHDKLLQEIKNKAQILAGRARSFKSNIEMDPMPSYERMIIHAFFQGSPDIKTESVGIGPKRRIILKYVGG